MLGAELSKAEARQGKNLWVTLKAIDGLSDKIAAAKRTLDEKSIRNSDDTSSNSNNSSGDGKQGKGKGKGGAGKKKETAAATPAADAGEVLKELAKECESMKPLESVGSEHKNFHATISKLAKAAEKVGLWACCMHRSRRGFHF